MYFTCKVIKRTRSINNDYLEFTALESLSYSKKCLTEAPCGFNIHDRTREVKIPTFL